MGIMTIDEVVIFFNGATGPFRLYRNPMRTDGVFIGEDRPIKPYRGVTHLDGSPIFPAVPDALVFPHQLPLELADEVLAALAMR